MTEPPYSEGDEVTAVVSSQGSGAVSRPERLRFEPGQHIGRYIVLSEVGEGGMGVVYRAYDPKLRREVALKCLRSDALDPEAEARMVREARAMAQLSHPNVVAVFDVDVSPHGLVLTMEYVPGRTLRQWVKGSHDCSRIVERFVEAGRGLAIAHEAGIVHRDFKPANVLVAEDERVKVTDFGLATRPGGSGPASQSGPTSVVGRSSGGSQPSPSSGEPSYDERLTRADVVMGTPRYMAPEQHAGRDADARSDQYAFCVALWEALCGEPPFDGTGPELGKSKLRGCPAFPKTSDVPRSVARAIERGLNPAASKRWNSMDDLLDALSVDPVSRRRSTATVLGMVGVAFAAAAGVFAWSARREAVCAGGDERLARVWNPPRVERVDAAVDGAVPGSRVRRGLSAYADSWARAHREACEATRLRKEQSASVMRAKHACLEHALSQFDAVLEVLERADERVKGRIGSVTSVLEPIAWCDDIESPGESPVRDEAEERDESNELRRTLHELRIRAVLRDREGGERLLASSTDALRGLDDPALAAWVELEAGRLLVRTYEPAEAELRLQRALAYGLEFGPPQLALDAATLLLRVLGREPARMEEALLLARVARGVARRVDSQGPRYAAVLLEQARILEHRGDYESALSELRAASDAEGRNGLSRPSPERIEAEVAAVEAHRDDALRESRRRIEQVRRSYRARWGLDHPEFARALARIGEGLRRGGHHEAALELLREARTIFGRAQWATVERARVDLELARVHARKDEVAKALAFFEDAHEAFSDALGARNPLTLQSRLEQAELSADRGRLADAAALYVALVEDLETHYGATDPRHVDALVKLAAVRRAQGDAERSISLLLGARELVEDVRAPAEVELEIALALAELHARDAQGRRFVEEARAWANVAADEDVLERIARVEETLNSMQTRR